MSEIVLASYVYSISIVYDVIIRSGLISLISILVYVAI